MPFRARFKCLVQLLVVVIVPIEGIVHILPDRLTVITDGRSPLKLLCLLAPLGFLPALRLARRAASGKERDGAKHYYFVFHDVGLFYRKTVIDLFLLMYDKETVFYPRIKYVVPAIPQPLNFLPCHEPSQLEFIDGKCWLLVFSAIQKCLQLILCKNFRVFIDKIPRHSIGAPVQQFI